jgi:hypothetical protein
MITNLTGWRTIEPSAEGTPVTMISSRTDSDIRGATGATRAECTKHPGADDSRREAVRRVDAPARATSSMVRPCNRAQPAADHRRRAGIRAKRASTHTVTGAGVPDVGHSVTNACPRTAGRGEVIHEKSIFS